MLNLRGSVGYPESFLCQIETENSVLRLAPLPIWPRNSSEGTVHRAFVGPHSLTSPRQGTLEQFEWNNGSFSSSHHFLLRRFLPPLETWASLDKAGTIRGKGDESYGLVSGHLGPAVDHCVWGAWPWVNDLTFLRFSLLTCKMGLMRLPWEALSKWPRGLFLAA